MSKYHELLGATEVLERISDLIDESMMIGTDNPFDHAHLIDGVRDLTLELKARAESL